MTRTSTTQTLEPDSHSARMLACLKDVFQARRLRYTDVSALMGVSDKSIKRYMSGQGVTLPVLERLCAAAGLSLGELSELASSTDEVEQPWTTDEQEAVLAAEPKLAIVFALLTMGWTASRMEREGLADRVELNADLVNLDRLGLITLHANNRATIRARLRPVDIASPPLKRVRSQAAAGIFGNLDVADPAAHWRLNYARLGPASVERVVQRLNAFLAEIVELGRQDMDLMGDQVKWYAICGVVTEHEVLGLTRLRESSNKRSEKQPSHG